jgi:hypothetical protein
MAAWMTLSQAQLGEHPGDVRCPVRAGHRPDPPAAAGDAVPARSLSTLMHVVMLPLMLVVMLWRRSQDTS